MKKKILFIILAVILLSGAYAAWKFLGPSVKAPENKYFYIRTGESFASVRNNLGEQGIVPGLKWFDWTSRLIGFKQVKPGRYEIRNGMSLLDLVRMLRNGKHSPVDFVITKIRTKETLASRIGRAFECDSTRMIEFLNNPDSLRAYNLDTNTVMAAAMPYTYTIRWNSDAGKIFEQFYRAYKLFWTDERKEKAKSLGLTPEQVSTLASIIDEETNAESDKPNVASVYLNRMAKGMPLQADPTVKFAMKNFGLKRILKAHLETDSPYNTYRNRGLPPGPICTPDLKTIDAVLNSPKTDYIYFVASSAFDGTHIFTSNYNDHLKYARIYQQELNKRNIR
jgi:conserved hypothetical protein, YceG family